MVKFYLEKNVLDLSYKRNLQLLNIFLITGLGTLFAFVGAWILNPERILVYTFVIILVGSVTYIIYQNVDERLKEISQKIRDLK
ncbi:MAG: hypothetical protein AABW50_04840 [Nanoarchaeota archaeon]